MSITTNIPRSEPIPTPPRKSPPEKAEYHRSPGITSSWDEFLRMVKEDWKEQNEEGFFPDSHGNYPDRHGNYPRKSDFHGFSLKPTFDSYSDNNTSSGSSCFSSRAGSIVGSFESSFPELNSLFDEDKTIKEQRSSDLSTGSSGSRTAQAAAPILGPKEKENCSKQDSASMSKAEGKEKAEEKEENPCLFDLEM